jgi:hypothetical protein
MTIDSSYPHCRACGIRPHEHGLACHSNCPTCHGVSVVSDDVVTVTYSAEDLRIARLRQQSAFEVSLGWQYCPIDPIDLAALLAAYDSLIANQPPCDGGCNINDGPQEDCSAHGRPVRDVWNMLAEQERKISAVVDSAQEGLADSDDDHDMSAFWVLSVLRPDPFISPEPLASIEDLGWPTI